MTRIKICGITNLKDAQAAIGYGADALGFIGVPESPRFVTPDQFEKITQALPPFVQTVIVVNRPEDGLCYPADLLQHYNDSLDNSPSGRGAQGRIRSFRIKDESSLEELRSYVAPVVAVHLDAYSSKVLGGSGHTFPWDLALKAKELTERPIILSGGLTPENIVEAIAGVRPYAVDLSSGVEASPGIKDYVKLKAFIKAVRAWDLDNE